MTDTPTLTLNVRTVRQLVDRCGLVAVDYFTEILGWSKVDRDSAIDAVVAEGSALLVTTAVATWLASAASVLTPPGVGDVRRAVH